MVYQRLQPTKIYVWIPYNVERLGQTIKEVPQMLKAMMDQYPDLIHVRVAAGWLLSGGWWWLVVWLAAAGSGVLAQLAAAAARRP